MELTKFDVFISHASEDKVGFVAPVAKHLLDWGVRVWYDEFELRAGDSLSRTIDRGLSESRYGLVVLSKAFFEKSWPEYELRGLISKETGHDKVIIPIWLGVTREDVMRFSPPLADKVALVAATMKPIHVAFKVCQVVAPQRHKELNRYLLWLSKKKNAPIKQKRAKDLKFSDVRHEKLPRSLMVRLRVNWYIFSEVLDSSFESMVDNFKRDLYPHEEVEVWEAMAAAYLEVLHCHSEYDDLATKNEIFHALLSLSLGKSPDDFLDKCPRLGHEGILRVLAALAHVCPGEQRR